ncbi:hypothetical protein [Aureimonas leprariae]|uniref:Uncharacterized protein n=1 Tax=Plantimonas leprariae TaxID=2615207 RepID=A0A7V7PMD9_9HYPH|nr:hypothetical protein [Aureimonas leprariae]KAB0678051.1 hypothetical protein F6X38_16630 [Aureimonas leprariae]
MPVYSNPGFQQGVDNLMKLFAPPSGDEAAGWARANAMRAEAARKADAYARMTAKGATPALIDQFGVASGTFLPTQSYHAVDMGDATTRRGQDMESSDRRYGVDVGARTSAANNAADNERALATNQADNERAIGQTKLSSLAGFFGPLGKDQVRPAVPSQLMTLFGGPGGDLPAAEGRRSPMSETEVKGAERQDLRGRGLLTDQDLIDAITGDKAPVEALGPGGKPTFMSPGAAIRTGAQPAPKSPSAVFNNGGGEGAFDKTIGEKQAGLFIDLATDGVDARNDRALLDRLDEQTRDLPGGMLGGLQSIASGYGIKLGPNASNVEAANAIIARLVPAARQGMPGAASDRDVNLFKQSLPSLSQTPEGRRIVSDTLRGLAQAREEQARIATSVVNGEITRAEGMTALQNLPDAFASLRQAAGNGGGVETGAGATARPAAAASAAPVRVASPEEARRLPSGTAIQLPDGRIGKVP